MGWDGSTLYATKRVMIGLKPNDSTIYILGWKSTTSNCIYSGETWKKLKSFGFKDVIALDGGGSYHYVVNGKTVDTMSENR
jgi:exopolysaccharide biosynthesis protein